jgi:hypothetical protein
VALAPSRGRRLPPTPAAASFELQQAAEKPAGRRRELPKQPQWQSLDLALNPHVVLRPGSAHVLHGHVVSRSMNFPRVLGSPSHSETSGDEMHYCNGRR